MKMKTLIILFVFFCYISIVKGQQIGDGYSPVIFNFNSQLHSGGYNGCSVYGLTGSVPDTDHPWQHLLIIRHPNSNNNHQLQIGGSFAQNDRLFFRKIAVGDVSDGNSSWIELATRGSNVFNGDIRIGLFNDSYNDIPAYGNKLHFSGALDNTDPLWLARYNRGSNKSELRVNIGDDYGQAEDKFVIGVNNYSDQLWHPILTIQNDRNIIADGKITATEIVVKQNVWADFVFHPSYQLKPLTEVEKFIKTNGHLEDIPTAEQVEKDGVNVGEMQKILLQKVEELTLYVIELKKENQQLRTEKDEKQNHHLQMIMELKKEIELIKNDQK